jgi:hypothetical protein
LIGEFKENYLAELVVEEMNRLEELIKELPREIQQYFVNILEFII